MTATATHIGSPLVGGHMEFGFDGSSDWLPYGFTIYPSVRYHIAYDRAIAPVLRIPAEVSAW
jgi:hypothetical protein